MINRRTETLQKAARQARRLANTLDELCAMEYRKLAFDAIAEKTDREMMEIMQSLGECVCK